MTDFQPRETPVAPRYILREQEPGRYALYSAVTGIYLASYDRELIEALAQAAARLELSDLPMFQEAQP